MNYSYLNLIKKPIISEKSSSLSSLNKYCFEVLKSANKKLIKKAIEEIYKVKVSHINILNVKGKKIIYRGKQGRKANKKKVIVTLKKGYSIDILPR